MTLPTNKDTTHRHDTLDAWRPGSSISLIFYFTAHINLAQVQGIIDKFAESWFLLLLDTTQHMRLVQIFWSGRSISRDRGVSVDNVGTAGHLQFRLLWTHPRGTMKHLDKGENFFTIFA